MNRQNDETISLVDQLTAGLERAAQLAREDGIKYGTGIVIMVDDKIVHVSAEELKEQARQEAQARLAQESTKPTDEN